MPSKLPCAQWFTRHQRGERNICVLIITCMSRYVRNANIARTPYAYGLIAGGVVSKLIFDAEFKNILGFTVRAVVGPPPARRCAVQCAHDT